MQALLDSFIQEINTIDDVDELRRRLIALKREQLELHHAFPRGFSREIRA